MFTLNPRLAGSNNRDQSRTHHVTTYRQIPKRAVISAGIVCLVYLFVSPATAQEVGDRVVVTQDTVLKIPNGIVTTIQRGQPFDVKHVSGKWLWVPLAKPGWIDRRFVTIVAKAKAGSTHEPVATAIATVVEPKPIVPPTRKRTAPRVGISVGSHGIGVGIHSSRRGASISFGFGGHGHSHHGHRGRSSGRD